MLKGGLLERILTGVPTTKFSFYQDITTRVQWGQDSEPRAGIWKSVSFPQPFDPATTPSVNVTGFVRAGTYPTRTITPPSIGGVIAQKLLGGKVGALAGIAAAKIGNREISRIGIGNAANTVASAFYNQAVTDLGDWGIFNWMRNLIASMAWGIGYVTGQFLEWLWNVLLQPQVDQARNMVNSALSDQTDQINRAFASVVGGFNGQISAQTDAMNSALSARTDQINSAFASEAGNVNAALSSLGAGMADRVNQVLSTDFAGTWGLPSGVIPTPVPIRNVSSTGFQWLSLGSTTIHWSAVGRIHPSLLGGG